MQASKSIEFFGTEVSPKDVARWRIIEYINSMDRLQDSIYKDCFTQKDNDYYVGSLRKVADVRAPDVKFRARRLLGGEWDIQVHDGKAWHDYETFDWDAGERQSPHTFIAHGTAYLDLDGFLQSEAVEKIYAFLQHCAKDNDFCKQFSVEVSDERNYYFNVWRNGTILTIKGYLYNGVYWDVDILEDDRWVHLEDSAYFNHGRKEKYKTIKG